MNNGLEALVVTRLSNQSEEVTFIYDEAFSLMERAQILLDQVGLSAAAAHLDFAMSLVPDKTGTLPRPRHGQISEQTNLADDGA